MSNSMVAWLPFLACAFVFAALQVDAVNQENTWVSNQSSQDIVVTIEYDFNGSEDFITRGITAGNIGE
jgi:hypothetical protein